MQVENIRPQQVPDVPVQQVAAGVQAVNTDVYGQKKSNTDDAGTDSKNQAGHRAAKQVQDQVDALNRAAEKAQRGIRYTILDQPRTVMLQIVDSESGEVLDEIPSEKMVKLVDAMQKSMNRSLDQTV